MKDEKTATAKVGGITQNIDLGYACFQEKCNRVCIARAAINESVCEDSGLGLGCSGIQKELAEGGLSTTWDCHLKVAGDVDRKFTGFISCRN